MTQRNTVKNIGGGSTLRLATIPFGSPPPMEKLRLNYGVIVARLVSPSVALRAGVSVGEVKGLGVIVAVEVGVGLHRRCCSPWA